MDKLPLEYQKEYTGYKSSIEDRICDYIAGMTDRYAVNVFSNLFIPKPWENY